MKNEEMLRILNMVSEGRLTATQAADLIDAEAPEKTERAEEPKRTSLTSVLESVVHNAVQGATEALKSTTDLVKSEQRLDMGERRLSLSGSGCALEIRPHAGTELILQRFGLPARLVQTAEEVVMDMVGVRGQLLVPEDTPLKLTLNGCRLQLFNLHAPLALYAVGCDIFYEAPIRLRLDAHLEACNMEMLLDAQADPRVHIDSMVGRVVCPEIWSMEKHHSTWVRWPEGRGKSYIDVRLAAGLFKLTLNKLAVPIEVETLPEAAAEEDLTVMPEAEATPPRHRASRKHATAHR